MLHKLALAVLLPAMLLNGLWVVCPPQDGADSPVSAKESADCVRICAALEASLGRICLLLPGHSNVSISVIDYGSAVLTHTVLVQPADMAQQFEPVLPVSYGNPFLTNLTPPPKA